MGKYGSYKRGKQSIKNVPEGVQILDLVDFKSGFINMFKELQETTGKNKSKPWQLCLTK